MTGQNEQLDTALDEVIARFGLAVKNDVLEVKKLVDKFVAIPFNTRKVSSEEIATSFNLLKNIYSTTLSSPSGSSAASINYLIRRIALERNGAFNIIRVNMTPLVEAGGNHSAVNYVADMNQLFGSLVAVSTAGQLRGIVRVEKILESVRAPEQREAIANYISLIDL